MSETRVSHVAFTHAMEALRSAQQEYVRALREIGDLVDNRASHEVIRCALGPIDDLEDAQRLLLSSIALLNEVETA